MAEFEPVFKQLTDKKNGVLTSKMHLRVPMHNRHLKSRVIIRIKLLLSNTILTFTCVNASILVPLNPCSATTEYIILIGYGGFLVFDVIQYN